MVSTPTRWSRIAPGQRENRQAGRQSAGQEDVQVVPAGKAGQTPKEFQA